jgi:hypothetical protein
VRGGKIRTVLHLFALILIGAVIWVVLHALPLFLIGGLGWDDLRSVLLHRAYGSFTYEGDVIPGVRPSLATRLVVLALSPKDDARRAMVVKATAASEQRRKPTVGKVPVLLRMCTGMGQGAEMPRALVQARWFAAPPLGAQLRARSVACARERAW